MSNDINTKLSNELDRILWKREDNEDLSSAVKVWMKEEPIDISISNSDSKPDHETEDTKVEIEKVKTEEVETEEVETEKVEIEKVETEEVKAEKVETETEEKDDDEDKEFEDFLSTLWSWMNDEEVEDEKSDTEEIKVETEEVKAEEIGTEKVETEKVETEEVKAEKVKTEEVKAEKVETEKVETEEVEDETEKVETEEIETKEKKWVNQDSDIIDLTSVLTSSSSDEKVKTEEVKAEKVEIEKVKTEKVETEKVKAEEIETEKVEDETKEKDINDKDEEFVRKKSRPKIPEYVEDEEIKNLNFDVELKKRLPLFEDILKWKVKEVIINNDEEEIKNLVNTISEIIDPLYWLVSDWKVEKNTVLVKDAEEIWNEIEDTKEETQTKTEKKDYIKIIKEIKNKKMIIISWLIWTSIWSLLSYIINL